MPNNNLAWAGFVDIEGLELLAIDEELGLDVFVQFALSGQATDIDRALNAAQFTNPTTPGIDTFQPPLPGIDLTKLANPRSGRDKWKNSLGDTVNRKYVRGATTDGKELIHVWAGTT